MWTDKLLLSIVYILTVSVNNKLLFPGAEAPRARTEGDVQEGGSYWTEPGSCRERLCFVFVDISAVSYLGLSGSLRGVKFLPGFGNRTEIQSHQFSSSLGNAGTFPGRGRCVPLSREWLWQPLTEICAITGGCETRGASCQVSLQCQRDSFCLKGPTKANWACKCNSPTTLLKVRCSNHGFFYWAT